MSRIKRPSPALVVSILALVAAVAVPAYALTKKEKRVVRKVAKAQANKQITKRAPGLSVRSARVTDEVRNTGLVELNDPNPGDSNSASTTLLAAGPFTIRGDCYVNKDGTNQEVAQVVILGPPATSFSGVNTFGAISTESASSNTPVTTIGSTSGLVTSAHLVAIARTGAVISLDASAEVKDFQGDCVFGVTAVGP